jgi:RecA/RadA recombinase
MVTATRTTRRKRVVDSDTPAVIPDFNPYALMDSTLDSMEKKFSVNAMSIDKDEPRFSTGLLRLDLMLNGGLLGGGWYTFAGGEQSCKSTTAMTVLASIMSMAKFLGPAAYFDYEGSTQGDYIENIMHSMGVKQKIDNVFGVKDEDNGEWLIPPRVRYYAPSNGESFFNYLAKLEKELPDKVRIGKNWYYVYDHTVPNKKMLKGLYDVKYLTKANKLRVPAKDGSIQAIILVDSYPAMLPKQTEDKEEGDKSLGSQARMFADGLKRVKSQMRPKRVVVLGINQMRAIPMAMHGPTEDEPCGNSLKFFSDVRLRTSSVSLSTAGVQGKGSVEEEPSVRVDGVDVYRYIKVRTFKNKLGGRPSSETMLRLVVQNAEGNATGFCQTWDTYQYLKSTGQIGGNRKKIKFLEGMSLELIDRLTGEVKTEHYSFDNPFAGISMSWLEFKTLVEGDKDLIKDMCIDYKLPKPVLLRTFVRRQMASGKGLELYKAMIKAQGAKTKLNVEEGGDDE